MHDDNPFKSPGSEILEKMKGVHGEPPNPTPRNHEDALTHNQGGGSKFATARKKSADDESEDEDERSRKEQANRPPPEEPVDRTVVRITDIKWDRKKVAIGGTAIVSMDVAIPPQHAHITGITCTIGQSMPGGGWKDTEANPARCDAKGGKAVCELDIPQPLKNKDGAAPSKIEYRVTAKHAYSKETPGPAVEAVPGPPVSEFDSVIFYSPLHNEYLVFETEDDYKTLLPEIDALKGLHGKTRKSWETMDLEARKKMLGEIHEESEKLFEGKPIGSTGGAWDGPLQELLLVRQNPRWGKTSGWVYIRPTTRSDGIKIKGHWRSDRDATVKKNLEELLKKPPGSKEISPLLDGELKLKLFEVDPFEKQWPLKWHAKVNKEGKLGEQTFRFSKEAAVCRFALGWDGVEATANLKEKKFRIGTSGHISYGLFEGMTEGKFPWPERGVNLLEYLGKNIRYLDEFIAKGRCCLLRLTFKLTAKGFVGLTATGALALPDIDLSKEEGFSKKKKKGVKAEAGLDTSGFAGAQASAGFSIEPEWSPTDEKGFKALGEAGVDAGGMAGAGGEAKWVVEYDHGMFRFKAGMGLSIGLGLRGAFEFDVSVEQGWKFVGYLLHSVDYHFVVEIQKAAFEAYKNYAFTLMTEGHKALTAEKAAVVEVITDFSTWLSNVGDELKKVKHALTESSTATGTLSNVPPEALGQALITIMQTRDQTDFRSIMVILNSTVRWDADVKADPSANHKLKWTLRCVSDISIDDNLPETGSKKGLALKAGIKKIEDFGRGIRYKDENGNQARENFDFLDRFHDLILKHGIK